MLTLYLVKTSKPFTLGLIRPARILDFLHPGALLKTIKLEIIPFFQAFQGARHLPAIGPCTSCSSHPACSSFLSSQLWLWDFCITCSSFLFSITGPVSFHYSFRAPVSPCCCKAHSCHCTFMCMAYGYGLHSLWTPRGAKLVRRGKGFHCALA
jgi:hypothetical protein